jgi:hypothetical protein
VRVERVDNSAPVAGRASGKRIYLDTELTFTAVGRPSVVEE